MNAVAARQSELLERLTQVQERIDAAVRVADRDDRPTLIAVTKFFPVEDLITLADAGVRDFGENREQELASKVEYLRAYRPDIVTGSQLHFIGQLQSKKAKRVGGYADLVHSVDREKLVAPLAAAAHAKETSLSVLLQVDLDEESQGRGGVRPSGLLDLADVVSQEPALRLGGLMAVAPLGEEPARAFDRLAQVRARFLVGYPDATLLSAGMTGDLEEAVAIGATHLRVGSAILGSRPAAG